MIFERSNLIVRGVCEAELCGMLRNSLFYGRDDDDVFF